MRIERVVLDTNVVISAVISPAGKPLKVLMYCGRAQMLVTSEALMTEIETRLMRPRISKRTTPIEREIILDVLRVGSLLVKPATLAPTCRDPDDDIVLATALAGRADVIVTGDQDLLVLDPFQGIRILTPAAFLDAVSTAGP